MDKENPKVSVIICAYTIERLKDIHEAVKSVLSQTLKPHEVIISVDHNQELLGKLKQELPPQVKIVLNDGVQGLSETRNIGIRTSSGNIIAFLDDDAVSQPDWLYSLTKHFENPRVVAVGGMAVPIWPNGRRPLWFPEELDWIVGCTYKGLPLQGNEIRNVPGCNMAFRKDALHKVGLWENKIGSIGQSLKGGEEAELCLRTMSKMPGCLILWEPDATIRHTVPLSRASVRWVLKNSFDQGFCKAKLKKFSEGMSGKPLSTENFYLHYLLLTAIPQRLKKFYKRGSLLQMGAIIISIAAVGMGYLIGRARREWPMAKMSKRETRRTAWTMDFEAILQDLETMGVVSGLHTKKEKRLLYNLASRGRFGLIVEIGSFEGYSTIILGKATADLGQVVAVDPHSGIRTEADEGASAFWHDTWPLFNENIQKAGISRVVRPLKLTSEEAVVNWEDPIRLLFIDGSHRYEDVEKDFLLWRDHLVRGGIVAFHDCWISGVRRVITNYLLHDSSFAEFKFVPCCMFCATYLGKEHRQVFQGAVWRFAFWLRGLIEESKTLRKYLLHLLRRVAGE